MSKEINPTVLEQRMRNLRPGIGRPPGVPNKVNRNPAKAILEAAQERVVRDLVSLTEPTKPGVECPYCGQGTPRNEDTRLRAIGEVLDRGGNVPKIQQLQVTEEPDTAWMEFLTDAQLDQLSLWIDEARAKMPKPKEEPSGLAM